MNDPALPGQLDQLRRSWGFAYDIAFDLNGYWHARHVTSGEVMDAFTSAELDDLISVDYERRERVRAGLSGELGELGPYPDSPSAAGEHPRNPG